MFRGSYDLRTDDKGRVIVPVKFRALLGDPFIVTKGVGGCLFAMTDDVWRAQFEEKFTPERFIDEHLMRVERFFRSGLMEASVDAQGRFAISQALREFAGIAPQSDVLLIGMSNRIELWARERWDAVDGAVTDGEVVRSAAMIGIGREGGGGGGF